MINCKRFEIEDWHIIDRKIEGSSKGYYIREILDSGCTEYKCSSLTAQQRYDIISELGLSVLANVLMGCFSEFNKPYDAEQEAAVTYLLLCRELGLECDELKLSSDTSVGAFGVRCKGRDIPADSSKAALFLMRYLGTAGQAAD